MDLNQSHGFFIQQGRTVLLSHSSDFVDLFVSNQEWSLHSDFKARGSARSSDQRFRPEVIGRFVGRIAEIHDTLIIPLQQGLGGLLPLGWENNGSFRRLPQHTIY